MNILYIDTRDNKRIVVRLDKNGEKFQQESGASVKGAQTILPLIQKVLKKAKITPAKIDEIKVERGPGSFTGLRVGIAIANALSFSVGAKINGKKIGEIEEPVY